MLSRYRLSFLTPLLAASLCLGAVACGGTTAFSGAQAFAVAGTPPPPPPPPPPVVEAPKPPPRVELRDNKIEFKEKIQFEVNKAVIKPESDSLLSDIADVIKKNPQVKKLSIEGHASAEGDAKHNKTLSEQRAKAVVAHLVKTNGVDAARLVAKGWGSEKPIAPNDTEENREKNRRVEFLVVEQDVTQKKVEIDPATGKERVVGTKTESIKAPDAPADATHPATPAKPGAKPITTPKPGPTTKPAPTTKATPKPTTKPATPPAPAPKPAEKK